MTARPVTVTSLPSLIGTDRQISSATRRRADILRQIDTLIERAEEGRLGDLENAWVLLHAGIEGVTRENREARRAAHEKWETIKDAASIADYAAALRSGRELLVRETSAKWWIEAGEVVRALQRDAAQVVLGRFR